MAIVITKVCAYPGCFKRTIANQSYCELHLKKKAEDKAAEDKARGNSYQRGYNRCWQKLRASFLALHPLCVECLKKGKTVQATDVDHIKPHKGDKSLFWDSNNLQALCHRCHSRKTALEDSNFVYKTPRG